MREIGSYCNGGVYYLPHNTVASTSSLIKTRFRSPQPENAVGLSAAYAIVRYINRCVGLGEKLVLQNPPAKENTPTLHSTSLLIPTNDSSYAREEGTLLIAHPLLIQSTLTQSLILMVNGGDLRDGGQVGLVLTRPLGRVLSHLRIHGASLLVPFTQCLVFCGGDVDSTSYLSFLHTCDELASCSVEVAKGLYFCDDLDRASNFVMEHSIDPSMSFKVHLLTAHL